jgi:hypothetical protein
MLLLAVSNTAALLTAASWLTATAAMLGPCKVPLVVPVLAVMPPDLLEGTAALQSLSTKGGV